MVQKDIVLFGTGKYFENYMMCYGQEEDRRPVFAVDNDPSKAGSTRCGVLIQSPEALTVWDRDTFYVIICAARHAEIGKQLESMGITDYQYYCPPPIESAVPMRLTDGKLVAVLPEAAKSAESVKPADSAKRLSTDQGRTQQDTMTQIRQNTVTQTQRDTVTQTQQDTVTRAQPGKPYRIGYVPGVFDLFHIGHLNLLRNSKSRCEYLIAGVLTDELVEHFKKRKPVIPYAQRAAIVSAVSYVDRVVPVDFTNTRKIDAWKKYHFDCHFSGNDHGADWEKDLRQLREVGSNMEFFAYTKAISTTKLRERQEGSTAFPGNATEQPKGPEPDAFGNAAEQPKEAKTQAPTNLSVPRTDSAQRQFPEMEKFVAPVYRTPDKMKRVWDIELGILDEIDRICKKYDLTYFLVHGSLLGAVRHQGFIPWDDDLDIAMARKDYDKFVELAPRELPEPLSLHTPSTETDIFWGGYARIRNGRTTAMEPREMEHQGNLGIWVDVLPFDVCTLDDRKFEKKSSKIALYQRLIYAERYGRDFRAYMGLKPWKWRLYRLAAKCCGHDRLCGKLEEAQRLYTEEDSDQIAFFTGIGKYRRLQAANFAETAELRFSGRTVPVPVGYEKYLFEIMGRDYLKYPPEEERKPKHRGIYDPERPYTEYVRLLFDIFADVKGKKIILFGAGLMFEDYMKKYGDKYRPAFLADNDENKWNRFRMGIPIRRPEEILEVPEEKRKLIICSYYYREISEQLDKMGIHDYKVYVQELEWILRTEEQQEST